jgi:hypothetical protein
VSERRTVRTSLNHHKLFIIEIIASQEKIEDILTFAESQIKRGVLATVEKVQARVYRGGEKDA